MSDELRSTPLAVPDRAAPPAGGAPRIGIDGSSVVGQRTGIGQSVTHLLAGLARIWPEDWPAGRILVNSRRHPLPEDDAWLRARCFAVRHRRIPWRMLLRSWQYLKFPAIERLLGPLELIHSPSSYIPPVRAARRVVTVYDLYYKYALNHVEPYGGGYFAQTFAAGLPLIDHIIAISQFTRDELLRFFPLAPERISVIPLGVDREQYHVRALPSDGWHLDRLKIAPPYLLCVATIEPRKNLITLIEAYARARQIMRAGGKEIPRLVITGQPGWGIKALAARLAEARMADAVTLTGYVPQEALPALYRQALGFVFPSVYEGFGLPILEAMACGCPVAASNAASLPEVGGEAALYFNPRDSDAMARALVQFISEPMLRSELRDRGPAQAARFSWEANARATLDVYRHVLGEPTLR